MRGYNGNLSITAGGVTIERGLKGALVRKKSPQAVSIRSEDIREIWFQPSTGRWDLPGYVLVVDRDEPPEDFVARVRDDRAVTFLGHSVEWRRFAAEMAVSLHAPLREFPPETRSGRDVAKRWLGGSDRRT
jgi:hypothetical protein